MEGKLSNYDVFIYIDAYCKKTLVFQAFYLTLR